MRSASILLSPIPLVDLTSHPPPFAPIASGVILKGETKMYRFTNSLTVNKCRKRTMATVLITFSILLMMCAMSQAAPTLPPGNTVQQWNNIAEDTVVSSGAFQAEGFIYMGYVSAAVYDAVVSIEGGYQPYGSPIPADSGTSTDAAVVEAAYRTLLYYFPRRWG
jgi:hypothetical protein